MGRQREERVKEKLREGKREGRRSKKVRERGGEVRGQ